MTRASKTKREMNVLIRVMMKKRELKKYARKSFPARVKEEVVAEVSPVEESNVAIEAVEETSTEA